MFWWVPKKENPIYRGNEVDLREERKTTSEDGKEVTAILYSILLHDTDTRAGSCDLRLGMNEELYYAGNIGYNVRPAFRGHSYAYQACLILFPIARDLGMKELIITCSPENDASRKTLEKLGGVLETTADVPPDHWLYKRGETVKNIYRYDLTKG